jgi:hypothetical protein
MSRGSDDPHVRIVGPAAAFGRDPVDVLQRILDVAGLAMHAIGGVYLQPPSRSVYPTDRQFNPTKR